MFSTIQRVTPFRIPVSRLSVDGIQISRLNCTVMALLNLIPISQVIRLVLTNQIFTLPERPHLTVEPMPAFGKMSHWPRTLCTACLLNTAAQPIRSLRTIVLQSMLRVTFKEAFTDFFHPTCGMFGPTLRKGLMRDIGAFESPESLLALKQLLDANWIGNDLRQLMVLKVQLLDQLKIATDNHDRLHPRPGSVSNRS